jgi:hypothetical protein
MVLKNSVFSMILWIKILPFMVRREKKTKNRDYHEQLPDPFLDFDFFLRFSIGCWFKKKSFFSIFCSIN